MPGRLTGTGRPPCDSSAANGSFQKLTFCPCIAPVPPACIVTAGSWQGRTWGMLSTLLTCLLMANPSCLATSSSLALTGRTESMRR